MDPKAWLATRKGLFTLSEQPRGWGIEQVHFLGDPVSAVLCDPRDGWLYCALNLGHFGTKLHRSTDHGRSWHEVATPAFPEKPEGSGDSLEWKVQQIWTLEADPVGPGGTLWAGTLPGGLFRSTDGAASWQLVRSLWDRPERGEWFGGGYDVPGIHSICIDPLRPGRILLGISCGGVWVSDDQGANWRLSAEGMRATYLPPGEVANPNVQDPHRIVACRADPGTLWCQHHDGIWRSSDAGQNWQAVTGVAPSAFGFAVAAHPVNPEVAWFVPAAADQCRVPVNGAFVVNCTRDGGRSFETQSRGLPQEPSYDIVYRHGLDVDASGQRLLAGATSGRVWSSADGGDHWQELAAVLPPIYAVRLG